MHDHYLVPWERHVRIKFCDSGIVPHRDFTSENVCQYRPSEVQPLLVEARYVVCHHNRPDGFGDVHGWRWKCICPFVIQRSVSRSEIHCSCSKLGYAPSTTDWLIVYVNSRLYFWIFNTPRIDQWEGKSCTCPVDCDLILRIGF